MLVIKKFTKEENRIWRELKTKDKIRVNEKVRVGTIVDKKRKIEVGTGDYYVVLKINKDRTRLVIKSELVDECDTVTANTFITKYRLVSF